MERPPISGQSFAHYLGVMMRVGRAGLLFLARQMRAKRTSVSTPRALKSAHVEHTIASAVADARPEHGGDVAGQLQAKGYSAEEIEAAIDELVDELNGQGKPHR